MKLTAWRYSWFTNTYKSGIYSTGKVILIILTRNLIGKKMRIFRCPRGNEYLYHEKKICPLQSSPPSSNHKSERDVNNDVVILIRTFETIVHLFPIALVFLIVGSLFQSKVLNRSSTIFPGSMFKT